MTEQEQIELIKGWIKQYSLVVILGACLTFLAISGWQYFQKRQHKILFHASIIYDKMMAMRSQNNTEGTNIQANRLLSRYPTTIYGQMAQLVLAREAIIKKNYDLALQKFKWVITHSKDKSFKQIVRIRLARLLIAMHKPEDALLQLKPVDDPSFQGMIDEVRGDAFLANNNPKEARIAYQQALHKIPNAEVIRPLLQMKYDNLA